MFKVNSYKDKTLINIYYSYIISKTGQVVLVDLNNEMKTKVIKIHSQVSHVTTIKKNFN